MKNYLFGLICWVLVFKLGIADDDDNIVWGGDFEETSGDYPFFSDGGYRSDTVGWSTMHPNYLKKIEAAITLEQESGNDFFRLTNTKKKYNVRMNFVADVDPDWKLVRVGAKVRNRDLQRVEADWHVAGVWISFLDDEFQLIKPYLPSIQPTMEDEGWEKLDVEVEVPEGASYLSISPMINGYTGTIEVDDLVAYPDE